MALTGLFVVQGFAGGNGGNNSVQPLITNAMWSENLQTPGVTTKTAKGGTGTGRPIFRVRCAVDAFVSIGEDPDASNGPSYFVAANTDYDFFANPEDSVAWVEA